MGAHTKTPLRISQFSGGKSHELDIETAQGWFLRLSPGYPFGDFPCPEDVEAEFRANAAFIVCAVNSHDALVEALREARTTLSITRGNILTEMKRGRDYPWEDVPDILKARIDRIDAALALAEPPS